MKDRHKPGYRKPGVGQPRRQHKPLAVDRLPQEIRDAIRAAYEAGKNWTEITADAAAAARKLGVNPPTGRMVRNWHDQRIEQAERRIEERSKATERIVKKWSAIGLKNLPEAVKNKLADLAFEIEQYSSEGNEKGVEKSLVELGWLLSDLRKSEVAAAKLELDKEKLETRRQAMAATSPREVYLAATEELLKKLRTRKDVRAVLDPISKELIEELSKSAEAFAKRIEAQSA